MDVAPSLREPQGSWQSGLSWGEGVVIVREVREFRDGSCVRRTTLHKFL